MHKTNTNRGNVQALDPRLSAAFVRTMVLSIVKPRPTTQRLKVPMYLRIERSSRDLLRTSHEKIPMKINTRPAQIKKYPMQMLDQWFC